MSVSGACFPGFRSTPEEGGETAFPFAKTGTGEKIRVKATRGDAVLFYK